MPIENIHTLQRSALLIAHPGHEALLHGWLECAKPIVFVMSDGSGGLLSSRMQHSSDLIANTGAQLGPINGTISDKNWYAAMLSGDTFFFRRKMESIIETLIESNCDTLVFDPLEFYNPLHDLANAMAHGAARLVRRRTGKQLILYTYPIEKIPAKIGDTLHVPLNDNMLQRKKKAISSYAPLAREATEMAETLAHPSEHLYAEPVSYAWPEHLSHKPYYEERGEARMKDGIYGDVITYRQHVRPIALKLLNRAQAMRAAV